jgi:hypothetical protein
MEILFALPFAFVAVLIVATKETTSPVKFTGIIDCRKRRY